MFLKLNFATSTISLLFLGADYTTAFMGSKSEAHAFLGVQSMVHALSIRHRPGTSRQEIIALASSWEPQSSDEASSSSVGDYVKGVHGGKYQFEDAGGATFAGRQFAESLYASDSDEGVVYGNERGEAAIPAWAERMGSSAKLGTLPPLEAYPLLSVSRSQPTAITIANDERSWEHYYSKVVQVSSDGRVLDDTAVWCHQQQSAEHCIVTVSPATGHLAPRGGSSNLCDPGKPYSDSAHIQIQLGASSLAGNNAGEHLLLIVGTEAETWCYWIQVDDK